MHTHVHAHVCADTTMGDGVRGADYGARGTCVRTMKKKIVLRPRAESSRTSNRAEKIANGPFDFLSRRMIYMVRKEKIGVTAREGGEGCARGPNVYTMCDPELQVQALLRACTTN